MGVIGQLTISGDPGRVRTQLQDIFSKVDREFSRLTSRGEATWDPANIAAGGTTSTTIATPGARPGDAVRVFPPLALTGLMVSGSVDADDVVTVVLFNPTAGGINLASGLWRVAVERY